MTSLHVWLELIITFLRIFIVSLSSLWFISFASPSCSFLTLTYSRFDISLASFLCISLLVWFASLSHYWYYIHIGHPQVHGSRAFLYMLHFTHGGAWVFYHWVFGPRFPSFLLPYHPSLHYVPCLNTTLRPWDQISSSTGPTWTGVWDLVDI